MSIFKKLHKKKGISLDDPKIKKQIDDLQKPKPLIAETREGELYLQNAEHLTNEQVEGLKRAAAEKWKRQKAAHKKQQAVQPKYAKEQDRLKKLGMEKLEGGRKNHFIKTATEEVENIQAEIKAAESWLKAHGYKKQVKDSIINHQPVKTGQWFKDYSPQLTPEENQARLDDYHQQQKNIEAQGRARNLRIMGEVDAQSIPKV